MVTAINFWTPVQFRDQPATTGQKLTACVDNFLYLKGTVAVVIPDAIEKTSTGVKLQEGKTEFWLTAVKVACYVTVILPAIALLAKVVLRYIYPFHICSRELPNGTVETGTFVNDVLEQGIRVENEQTFYIRPKLLLGDIEFNAEGIELNFAEVIVDGRTEIIPVQKPLGNARGNEEFTRYRSAGDALLKMVQNTERCVVYYPNRHYGSPVKHILNHAHNHLLMVNPFLTSLITPNEEGLVPIHTVTSESLLEILQLARENGFAIDAQIVKALFNKWAIKGSVELVQTLLVLDPSAIQQDAGQEGSFFAQAVLSGQTQKGQLLLQAMQAQTIPLSHDDQWIHKAFINDCNFTNDALLDQPFELRCKIFQIANIYIHKELLHKLRDCGLRYLLTAPEGPALFSYNMDAIVVEQTLQDFLGNLRNQGLLLTQNEFAQKDPAQYCHKGDDLGRILGRDYIKKTAQHMDITSFVKVPSKIAIIQPKIPESLSVAFTIIEDSDFTLRSIDLQIYAERITPIDRKANRDEMMKLLDLVEKIGFNDFLGDNLMMGKNQDGEEGVYFIDTEYTNFSYFPYHDRMGNLGRLMSPDDHGWLEGEIHRRQELFEVQRAGRQEALAQEWEQQKPIYIQNGFAHRRKPFTYFK